MVGYIYLTTNLINGKIYIGQHICKTFDHNYYGSGTRLKKAISEYGKRSFKMELLYKANSYERLNIAEITYIEIYNSSDPEIGYNITKGGTKYDNNEEARKRIEINNKNRQKIRDKISKNRLQNNDIRLTNIGDKHKLTVMQSEILRYIKENNNMFTITRISNNFSFSRKAAQDHIQAILRKEYIEIVDSNVTVIKIIKDDWDIVRNPSKYT
jgi:hypothetical protein